jgi:hypothetical protein
MGSKGSKPRKPSHSQHLPKVGSAAENQKELHEEQQAVFGQFGLRHAGSGTKVLVGTIVTLLVIGAILGLLLLIVFR